VTASHPSIRRLLVATHEFGVGHEPPCVFFFFKV